VTKITALAADVDAPDRLVASTGSERDGAGLLVGRRSECERLDQLIGAVRGGESRALIVVGEPGVGKTALLEYAVTAAPTFRVARAAGVESEMELAFAALQQVCGPLLDHLEQLPRPHRDALSTAFGLIPGPAPDRFLVGLAALGLLSEAAADRPLLCVIDDAQWLDQASAQALAFVARRLSSESIALLLATRDPAADFNRLEKLPLTGLDNRSAREVLLSVVPGPLDDRVRERIIAETRGNPLALLELPHGLAPAELAGGFAVPTTLPLSDRIQESFLRRLASAPRGAQTLLLIAAAEPVGDPALLWRGAGALGLPETAVADAEETGLLDIATRVRFRHPLVRSAIYGAASPAQRRAVHGALAEATDAGADPDRRAWHRAQAAAGPDDGVAGELERSAGRAQSRGGFAAAAAFLERAAALTRDPALRARRGLAAARLKLQAGGFDAALELLRTADIAGGLDDAQRGHVELLRARVAFASGQGSAAPQLLRAAQRLEPLDPAAARATYLDALSAAIFAGRLAAPGGGVQEVAYAIRAARGTSDRRGATDLLLDGWATYLAEGYEAGLPKLREALSRFGEDSPRADQLGLLWWASVTALHLWDDERWELLSDQNVQHARDTGALSELPLALSPRAYLGLLQGEIDAAAPMFDEAQVVIEATGSSIGSYRGTVLAAVRGDEPHVLATTAACTPDVIRRGEGLGLASMAWARALLYNSLGHHGKALAAAREATEGPPSVGPAVWAVAELIEAAARGGEPAAAHAGAERLTGMARAAGTPWALGVEARCRALLREDASAEELYQEAVDHLGRCRMRLELARAHLTYGEWLRRRRRRADARDQLRCAHELFTGMGAEAFAARAEQALRATGERARQRIPETRDDLTPQERQVARLAQSGLSNAEIGERLFISPKTVEYHLAKVFAKLGIRRRQDLHTVLAREPNAPSPV
jgi:DNA-binding CsgD family transcriptional regulator